MASASRAATTSRLGLRRSAAEARSAGGDTWRWSGALWHQRSLGWSAIDRSIAASLSNRCSADNTAAASHLMVPRPTACSSSDRRYRKFSWAIGVSNEFGSRRRLGGLGISCATKDVATKASDGTAHANAALMRPPVLCPDQSNHGPRVVSQSRKSCRMTPHAWSARRNIRQRRSASRDIRCLPSPPI